MDRRTIVSQFGRGSVQLVAFSLQGYRRFVEKTSVKLHGDVIAFVGPNEAGKSSLLRAMAHLDSAEPFEPNEHPRRTSHQPTLSWHFQLDREDREALAGLPDAGHIERAVVSKSADGTRAWTLEPREPARDRTSRSGLVALLEQHRDDEPLAVADEDEESEFTLGDYQRVIETLTANTENYGRSNLDGVRDLARRIRAVELPLTDFDPDDEDAVASHELAVEEWGSIRAVVADRLEKVAAEESVRSPRGQVIDTLTPRLPKIFLFEDEDRNLSSEYDLNEVAEEPPPALDHLANLAGLDLVALRDELNAQSLPDAATRRNAANERLRRAFDESWNQQGIAIQIEYQGTALHIHATTPADAGLSAIDERSDGMRWFAALLAYAHGWSDKPILLVDEIEQHLHYDAQSDLVQVLTGQEFTSKVIYTTHSEAPRVS